MVFCNIIRNDNICPITGFILFLKSDQFVIFIDTESIAVYKLFIPAFITTVQITECQIMLLRIAMCIRLGVCQNAELIADFIVSFKS